MMERGKRKKLTGVVVGHEMDKTAMVLVGRIKKHGTYGKYIRRQKKYMVHDPQNACQTGDTVRIIESRPISKRKRWQVIEVIESSKPVETSLEQANDSDADTTQGGR